MASRSLLRLPANLGGSDETIEMRLTRIDARVSHYLDRLAEESGISKQDLIRGLLTHAAGMEARSLSIVESEGGVLYVDAPHAHGENDFALWLSRIRYQRRWPWLTPEERERVAEARSLIIPLDGEDVQAGLERAAAYLREHGFKVTKGD